MERERGGVLGSQSRGWGKKVAAAKGFEPQIASRCVPLESEELRFWGRAVRSLWGNRMEARFPFQMVD